MRVLVALGVLLIAGCSGSSAGNDGGGSSSRPDASSIAASFGCADPQPIDGGPEIYVAVGVQCQYKGAYTTVNVFQSEDSQKLWEDAAKSVTGGDGTVVVGDRFVVEADDANAADEIAAKVDGSVQ